MQKNSLKLSTENIKNELQMKEASKLLKIAIQKEYASPTLRLPKNAQTRENRRIAAKHDGKWL